MRQRINAAEHAQCLHRRLLVNTSLHPLLLCPCWLLQVRNWPSSRGSVVGTMKASIGLSGACLLLQHLLQLHCFKHACVRAYAQAGGRARAASGHRDTPAHSSPPTPLADARPPCSGSLFACIYSGAFAPDSARFLLFLALARWRWACWRCPSSTTAPLCSSRSWRRGSTSSQQSEERGVRP